MRREVAGRVSGNNVSVGTVGSRLALPLHPVIEPESHKIAGNGICSDYLKLENYIKHFRKKAINCFFRKVGYKMVY